MNIKELIIGLKSHYTPMYNTPPKYQYGYVNTITGEVRTISSDNKRVIKLLYEQMDGYYRENMQSMFKQGDLIICALHSEKCVFYKHIGRKR